MESSQDISRHKPGVQEKARSLLPSFFHNIWSNAVLLAHNWSQMHSPYSRPMTYYNCTIPIIGPWLFTTVLPILLVQIWLYLCSPYYRITVDHNCITLCLRSTHCHFCYWNIRRKKYKHHRPYIADFEKLWWFLWWIPEKLYIRVCFHWIEMQTLTHLLKNARDENSVLSAQLL